MRIERAVAVEPVGMRAEQLGGENKQILEVDASGTLGRLVERQEFLFVAGLRAKRFDPAHSLAHLLQREQSVHAGLLPASELPPHLPQNRLTFVFAGIEKPQRARVTCSSEAG